MAHFTRYAIPPLAWAGLIFFLSGRPASTYEGLDDAAPQVPGLSYLVHGLLYLILAGLLLRWLLSSKRWPRVPTRAAALIVIAATCIYGLSDEVHQAFVPGRAFEVLDLAADAAGAAIPVAVWAAWRRITQ